MSEISFPHATHKQKKQHPHSALFRENAPFLTMKRHAISENDHPPSTRNKFSAEINEKMKDFIGMDKVKQQLSSYFNIVKLNSLRASYDLPAQSINAHMVFTGNPGTGKTTTARLLGSMFKEAGVLSSGHVVEMTPNDLGDESAVGSEIRTMRRKMNQAKGGILFIDEAHQLPEHSAKSSEFWRNAVTELLQAITAPKTEFCVVLAGYEEGMKHLFKLEPGLNSRFPNFIHFDNYSTKELTTIFERNAENMHYTLATGCHDAVFKAMDDAPNKLSRDFGNARHVNNFFNETIKCVADRIASLPSPTKKDISTITAFDVNNAFEKKNAGKNSKPQIK